MEPTPKIRLKPRPVLALALVLVAVLGLITRGTQSSNLAIVPATSAGGHPVTTTTVGLSPAVQDASIYRAPGGGCGLNEGPVKPAGPIGRCRVLEFGDSIGIDLGEGLSREVTLRNGVNLSIHSKVSTGLVNTSYFNWPARLRYLIGKFRPQLVVAFVGANDQHSIRVGDSSARFGSSRWQSAYLTRIREIAADVRAGRGYLLWVGLPPMQDWRYERGAKLINSLIERVARTTAGMAYISTVKVFSTPAGRYEQWAQVNGVPSELRAADGIHLRRVGDDVLATYVVRQIARIYHVALFPRLPRVVTAW